VNTQFFDIANQMPGGIGIRSGVRGAKPGTALVEHDNPVVTGVEKSTVLGVASGARSTMQKQNGHTVGVSRLLPIQVVAVAHIQSRPSVGFAVRVEIGWRIAGVHKVFLE